MQHNPLMIEVLRGNCVESVHAVDAVVCDGDGNTVSVHGDGERGVFPRSAIKALQALPLVESGAADAFGFSDAHLALACSSHNGEAFQTRAVLEMLADAKVQAKCLECGAQAPYHRADIEALARDGTPVTAVHNNCSGKHAGFLALASHLGMPLEGYVKPQSPLMLEIVQALEETTRTPHRREMIGTDGCSIPTYQIPLVALAAASGRFSVSNDPSKSRSEAMTRLRNACMAHPDMVAGTGRFDTAIMEAMGGLVFTKTGAEGVFTIALPKQGIGIAVKCHDGATRAAEVAAAYMVTEQLARAQVELTIAQKDVLKTLSSPVIRNWNGLPVGLLRVAN